MIDFHTHILPNIDDGAKNLQMSLEMIKDSFEQGINIICATPHFNPYEESISSFLKRRNVAYGKIYPFIKETPVDIKLGCEVLYFPGMSECEEIRSLVLGGTNYILIEPPMSKWSDYVTQEIEEIKNNYSIEPVIAHLDRYMEMLDDYSIYNKIDNSKVLVQLNTNSILGKNRKLRDVSIYLLENGGINFVGSDCHNMTDRRQNYREFIKAVGSYSDLDIVSRINNI